ncbi:MAG: rod-binding protein [Clostridiales bacterium]|nr:rod-binding protein [Clostridiales bacterium]
MAGDYANGISGLGGAAGLSGASAAAGLSGQSGQAVSAAQDSINKAETDSFEAKLKLAMTSQDDEELKDACVQFEELMLGIMYKQMKATVQRSDLTEADPGRETFEQWQDDALMKEIAKNGSFGLADMMYKQLSKRMKNAYDIEE